VTGKSRRLPRQSGTRKDRKARQGCQTGKNEKPSPLDESRLNPLFNFDSFVPGKANDLARAAALQVADNPGAGYNPLFVYGGVGLGKTHLVQAIGNRMIQADPKARIRYIHADRYVSDVVRAVRTNSYDDFKRRYDTLDLLLIDDIQFFPARKARSNSSSTPSTR
jgi:chromosomal replication initiator protein